MHFSWIGYQSILLAFLTKISLEKPFDTFEQAIEAGLPLYVIKGAQAIENMRDSANTVIREAFQINTLAKNAFFENVGVAHGPAGLVGPRSGGQGGSVDVDGQISPHDLRRNVQRKVSLKHIY